MPRLAWGSLESRQFESGVDRGVLYLKDQPAVPWDGITGVDETGGDSAVSYFIDGRPFLFVPKPKEFTAVLRAWTFPDAFSGVMGVTEAADGMYIDSQNSDSFSFCYRSLIGNAQKGHEAGYKIHLVYNATVVPQGTTRNSNNESINPVEFSWDIQAVPVAIEGYRATAHVIIDTRNMDPVKLAAIEAMIYGVADLDGGSPGDPSPGDEEDGEGGTPSNPSGEAFLPTPQQVFDIITFGDTIIITDNGDGTWEAKGSHENIYLIGDGIFQIDNIDAIFNGDGTYTISSTNV